MKLMRSAWRRFKLLCLLFACIFMVSGCTVSDLPIKRTTNSNSDVVKFYGFEWLTERSTIEKKFKADFDSEYVCKEESTKVSDDIDVVHVLYKGKDETDLDWTVANHHVSELLICYIKTKSGKNYLFRAIWRFNQCNEEDVEFFYTKLDKLYPNTLKNNGVYIDKNVNQVGLSYTDSTKEITLDYCCCDLLYQLLEKGYGPSEQESMVSDKT